MDKVTKSPFELVRLRPSINSGLAASEVEERSPRVSQGKQSHPSNWFDYAHHESLRASKVRGLIQKLKLFVCLSFALCTLHFTLYSVIAQETDLDFSLNVNSETTPLPKIFRPNIDLSGRGFSHRNEWPNTLAAAEVLDSWQKDIGFNGVFRLQYNLWEINELAKDKDLQNKLLSNYEDILKKVTDAGGVVILEIYGTPAGLGKVLDKKSSPFNVKAFKELVKSNIKTLSCDKKYNIWYEVWGTPDLDTFFLGRKQEYLNLYRAVAESIKELEAQTKINIPIGGPSTSWWFQNFDGNTIINPERSLIYELIRFCYQYRLPLDFISWHAYSADPKTEKELTAYKKSAVDLIKTWLFYFHFKKDTPLIIDEWNYDSGINISPERAEKASICASYIPSRIQNMYTAGLSNQVYFSLEDFHSNKEGVASNVGAFWFDSATVEYKGGPKSIYNVFRMLASLGDNLYVLPKVDNEFVGVIPTKTKEGLAILIYNYIDPQIATNYLSRNIATLSSSERKILIDIIKSKRLGKIVLGELAIPALKATKRVKALLRKAKELDEEAKKFTDSVHDLKINIKNIKGDYLYQRFNIDLSCSLNCDFMPVEEKTVNLSDSYQDVLSLNPYSVNLIIFKNKPKEPEKIPQVIPEQKVPNADNQAKNTTQAPSNTEEESKKPKE